jgi:dolichol-phosphate mannosyltransferase
MPKISIVIPVLNEVDSLDELFREIKTVAESNHYDVEIVFVDDGSTDGSWDVMSRLAATEKRVIAIRFRKNFGKASALRAGIEQSVGEIIVTMDADLQDDPAEMPALIDKLHEGLDCVSGWKTVRQDSLGKRMSSKLFNWLVGWLTGTRLHDHNCGFKAYRREIFDEVRLYGERHRFIPVLAAARGYRVDEVPVHHRARRHGKSKYGFRRLPKGFLDLLSVSFLTGFNQRPQHFIGSVGLASFGLGLLGLIWMSIYWILRMTAFEDWEPLHQRPVVLYSVAALLLGAQLLCMGFLAELIVARGQDRESPFSISDRVPENRPVAGSVHQQQTGTDDSNQTKAV